MAELNGTPVAPEALQALGLLNYGHFTSIRVDDQSVRGLSHHLDRLVHDCRILFGAELDRARIRHFIRNAIAGKAGSFVVRVTLFDPAMELGQPSASGTPSVLVTTRPAGRLPATPIRVRTASYSRDLPEVKHIGLFGAVLDRRNAQLNGFDDALFVDDASFVSEGTTWNVGFFDGERVVWPSAPVLAGVTMRLLKQVHEHTVTIPVHIKDIPRMEAAFATNTTIGVRPITAINAHSLPGDHPIFQTLQKEYEEIPAERL